jgi:predicted Zn-dependent protease
MKVTNYTKYDTATLRKIASLCLAEFARRERTNKHRRTSYTVDFTTHKGQGWVGGCASYNSDWLTIKLPLLFNKMRYINNNITFVQAVADVIFHELGHCIGVHHRLNRGNPNDTIESEYREWVLKTFTDEWTLPLEQPKAKPDAQLARYSRARENAERAMTRYKRAKTLLSKWNTKVKYYEKTLAKAGKLPPNN